MKKKKLITMDGKPLETKKPSITIGRPIARAPIWENQVAFQAMFIQLLGEGYTLYDEDFTSMGWWGVVHSTARNRICQAAMERGSDYVMFIDDDMTSANMAINWVSAGKTYTGQAQGSLPLWPIKVDLVICLINGQFKRQVKKNPKKLAWKQWYDNQGIPVLFMGANGIFEQI